MIKTNYRKGTQLNLLEGLFSDKIDAWSRSKVFSTTELGQVHAALPLDELVAHFMPHFIKERQHQDKYLGGSGWFDIKGALGLMFLKSYYNGISDAKLIEQLNGSWELQYFCGISLPITRRIKDKDLVGRWRRWFAKHMNIEEMQRIFLRHWKGDLSTPGVRMSDATCYESAVKYPTSVKLLWDSIEWLRVQHLRFIQSFKLKKPDNQYTKLSEDVKAYNRLRRRPKKRTKKIIYQLLRLQERMTAQLQTMLNQYRKDISLLQGGWSAKDDEKMKLCRTILTQQKALRRDPDSRIPDRICSWAKPYLRPIVRGKENKVVEFGCFVNTIYVDGIQLIEHAAFKMYHEGNRLPYCVIKYSNELGRCTNFGGDNKYATNKNRKFCKKRDIFTSFRAKGAVPKEEHKVQQRQLQKELGVIRATHLEGAYGNEKNHYGLKKVKARGEANELAWIFFGIFTANAVSIAKRRRAKKVKPKPAQALSLKAQKAA
jgi:hypothetical protein